MLFCSLSACLLLLLYTEQTVQQERIPQPRPPPKFGGGVETSVSEPDVQLKDEITFFTFLDEHFGHSVSLSEGYKLCSSENFALHLRHIYSYIGMLVLPVTYEYLYFIVRPRLSQTERQSLLDKLQIFI